MLELIHYVQSVQPTPTIQLRRAQKCVSEGNTSIQKTFLLSVLCRPEMPVGDSAIELSFLISVGIMGSLCSRNQVAATDLQKQSRHNTILRHRDRVAIRAFRLSGSVEVSN